MINKPLDKIKKEACGFLFLFRQTQEKEEFRAFFGIIPCKKSLSRADFYELEYERNNFECWKGSLWGKKEEVY